MAKRMKLKHFRIDTYLTQQEMADILGVSRVYYTAIENGQRNPKLDFWDKLQKEFSVPDSEMYSLQKKEERNIDDEAKS